MFVLATDFRCDSQARFKKVPSIVALLDERKFNLADAKSKARGILNDDKEVDNVVIYTMPANRIHKKLSIDALAVVTR